MAGHIFSIIRLPGRLDLGLFFPQRRFVLCDSVAWQPETGSSVWADASTEYYCQGGDTSYLSPSTGGL